MSEKKLPYDVVFLLNRYFRAMGEAIESAGGQVDNDAAALAREQFRRQAPTRAGPL